jgi:hypothetical protein
LGSLFASREFLEGRDDGAAEAQKLDKEKISSNVKFIPDKSLKKFKTAKPCQAKNLTKQEKNLTKSLTRLDEKFDAPPRVGCGPLQGSIARVL